MGALRFSGVWFHQPDTSQGRAGKGWPTALGALVLPNDTQALSPGRAAFCLQAKVTVVAELVPYWRLILGEGEKSGQCGSH